MADTNNSLTRNVHAYVAYELDSGWVDISSAISTVTIKEIACSGSVLKMGEFCKNAIEFEYYPSEVDGEIAWNNKRIQVGLEYSSVYSEETLYPNADLSPNKPEILGIFYVDGTSITTSNNGITYKVTGYDMPSIMSEEFDTTKAGTKVSDILTYLENTTGLAFKNKELITLSEIDRVPEKTTNAGLIAYLVGYEGYNARMSADGQIELYWYYTAPTSDTDTTADTDSSLYTITRDEQYLNGFTNNAELPSLNAIASGKGTAESDKNENPVYTVGTGEALTYQNPYITQEQVNKIYERVKGFKYSTGTIKWRGEQSVRAGDTVRIETNTGEYVYFPVMESTFTFDGGMACSSSAFTYVRENTVMGQSPQEKRIQTVYRDLTKVFQQQTGIIKNNLKGGYYRLLQDENTKYPYGWQTANKEEIDDTTKGWQWTQGGLIHSSDGFKTADKVAFTEDGHLAVEMIAANTVTIGQLNDEVMENITQNISNTKNDITEAYSTLIKNTSDQINEVVSKLTATSDENSQSIVNINNALNITADDINLVKTTTSRLQDLVDGKMSSDEIREWARFDGATLELGASNQPFKARLTTTELAFYQGNNKVAWISNNELHILTAIITQSIGVGNFKFIDEGDYGLSLI